MAKSNTKNITTKQVRRVPNPTGKGGFQDHPELRNDGRWDKENSYSYWLNYFKHLSIDEFKAYKLTHPDNVMTMAEMGAYARVAKTVDHLNEFQEVANRTEGMPQNHIDLTSGGKPLVVFDIDGKTKNNGSDKSST
jgi:hypothetical protein